MVICAANLLGVSKFGEFEFWFAIIKIVAVIAMIVGGLAVIIFALPTASGIKRALPTGSPWKGASSRTVSWSRPKTAPGPAC